MTRQDIIDNQPAHFEKILPGHPKPGEYILTNLTPYKMHQRCAERFHVGRICLAADAAHLCNPWGGLGLTGGFADTIGLAECLVGIANGQADRSILDKYDEERRAIFNSFINPISTGNFHRATSGDADKLLDNDPFLAMCAAAQTDAKVEEKLQKVLKSVYPDFLDVLIFLRIFMAFATISRNIIVVASKYDYGRDFSLKNCFHCDVHRISALCNKFNRCMIQETFQRYLCQVL